MQELSTVGALVGGLGALVLGLALVTDGAERSAGRLLTARVRGRERDRRRAFQVGLAAGALLPGSRSLFSATSGLVTCGFVHLAVAAWLVAGAAFGGSVAAWSAVAVRTSPAVSTLALVALAIGAVVRALGPRTRLGALGMLVAGVGLAGLGISLLDLGLGRFGEAVRLDTLGSGVASRAAIFLAIGALAAWLLRAPAPVVVVACLAAASGSLKLTSAAGLLLGGELGGAVAALRTLVSGTAEARPVAAEHVLVRAVQAGIGFALAVLVLPLLGTLPGPLSDPAFLLAAFASIVACAGVAVTSLVGSSLAHALTARLAAREPQGAHPHRVDLEALEMPELAAEGLLSELERLGGIARGLARGVLSGERLSEFRLKRDRARAIALGEGVVALTTRLLGSGEAARLAPVLIGAYGAAAAWRELCDELVALQAQSAFLGGLDPRLESRLRQAHLGVLHLCEGADPLRPDFAPEALAGEQAGLSAHLADLQRRLLARAAEGRLAPEALDAGLARLNALGRLASGSIAAASRVSALALALEPSGEGALRRRSAPSSPDPARTDAAEPPAAAA